MKKKSLYILILGVCLMSYGWLFFNFLTTSSLSSSSSICVFKNVTTIPCPACGTTRSVMSIFEGDISQAILYNPLGFFAIIFLIAAPFWIAYDFVFKKSSLLTIYQAMEYKLKNKIIAIPLVLIVLMNWIWNIMKGL